MARRHGHHVARANPHADLRARVRTHDEVELLEHLKGIKDPLVLVLDCVQDPHNLGACLRTADAAGVDAVIVPQRRSATITETVRKIACGGAEHVFFVQVVNLVRAIEHLQEAGLFVYGTSHTAGKSIYEENLTGPLALVLGAEATGIRRLTAETCDGLVSIPMVGTVECLNVSVATGVCLFEARRQREKRG